MAGAAAINRALIAKLGLDTSAFDRGLKGANSKARNAGRAIARGFAVAVTAVVALTAAVVAAIVALGKLAEAGQKVISVETAFNRVTGNGAAAVRKLTVATNGLISNYDLMVGFNRALALGAAENVGQFADLARTAVTLGRALGVDAAFALESLSLGIGRQSRLILDNLGIIVKVEDANRKYAAALGVATEALTVNQQKEAFRTEALEQARAAVIRLGESESTAGDAFVRFRVAVTNLSDEVKKLLARSTLLKIFFDDLANITGDIIDVIKADAGNMKEAFLELGIIVGNAFSLAFLKSISTGIIGRKVFAGFIKDAEAQMNAGIRRLSVLGRAAREALGGVGGGGPIIEIPEDLTVRINLLGDAIRDNVIAAVADLATEFKSLFAIIANLGRAILRNIVTALGQAVAQGGSLSAVLSNAGTLGLVGAGIGLLSQFFDTGGIVQPQQFAMAGGGVPVVAHPGEVVLSKRAVDNLGGPARANALNRGAQPGGGRIELVITAESIPEPTDFGIIATKPQVQRLMAATLRTLAANGFKL